MLGKLITEKLILKNYEESDIGNILCLRSCPEVWKFSTNTADESIEGARCFLSNILDKYNDKKPCFQAVFLKENNVFIGEAGVLSLDPPNKRTVIGYNILPSFWNKGYASEITKHLVKALFENFEIERIEALTMVENIASRKVLENKGFKLEGVLRNYAYINGGFVNVCYYGIIKSDVEKRIHK